MAPRNVVPHMCLVKLTITRLSIGSYFYAVYRRGRWIITIQWNKKSFNSNIKTTVQNGCDSWESGFEKNNCTVLYCQNLAVSMSSRTRLGPRDPIMLRLKNEFITPDILLAASVTENKCSAILKIVSKTSWKHQKSTLQCFIKMILRLLSLMKNDFVRRLRNYNIVFTKFRPLRTYNFFLSRLPLRVGSKGGGAKERRAGLVGIRHHHQWRI